MRPGRVARQLYLSCHESGDNLGDNGEGDLRPVDRGIPGGVVGPALDNTPVPYHEMFPGNDVA